MTTMRRRKRKYSDAELLASIRALARELGRAPSMVDFDKAPGERPSSETISGRFGSWSAAIERALGDNVRSGRRPADVDKLERDVLRLAEQYGRAPTVAELEADPDSYSLKPYRKHYGSWSEALRVIMRKSPYNITPH